MMIMTVVVAVGSDGYFFLSAWRFEESFCKAETSDLELEQYTGVWQALLVLKDNRRVSGLDQTPNFPSCVYMYLFLSHTTQVQLVL